LRKILIFGNSGSGKSTLAKRFVEREGLAHLDLDTLAWLPESPPKRAPIEESRKKILAFIHDNEGYVIEGCYTDLLEIAAPMSDELFYLNLPIEICIANARNRPWEPHKYESKEAQDSNLEMLMDWIKQYTQRDDEFSYRSHLQFYERFPRSKIMVKNNEDSVETKGEE